MTQTVRTAVFPVAGLGTRFLPATKATPKELLPVIDTPLIQYAIDEARDAGIERLIFVSHPTKNAIKRHVLDDAKLRSELRERGKPALAEELEQSALSTPSDDVIFTMQEKQLGLGHAVLCAQPYILDGAVAVLLPDDLIIGQKGCLAEMIDAYEGGHMVATMTVPPEETQRYGILSVTGSHGKVVNADGLVEKPHPDHAPSREAVVGRYILDPSIFYYLESQSPGAGGEIQLTDAISRAGNGVGLSGFRFSGTRFDCGSKQGMLRATLYLASKDPDYAEVLAEFCDTSSDVQAA